MFERQARSQSQAEYARSMAAKASSAPAQWQREAEVWFDGSPESVDRRLALCEKMLHQARTRLAHDSFSKGARHLETIASLEVDKGALLALRRDLLTAASDRKAGKHDTDPERPWKNTMADEPYFDLQETPEFAELALDGDYKGKHRANLSPQDRRFVELESAKFVVNNVGVGRDEIKIRAQNFAELKTSTFTPQRSKTVTAAFVGKVAEIYRRAPQPRVASAPRTIPDFPDSLMYL